MPDTDAPVSIAPKTPDCNVVELRQYTLHPHKRDVLIDLFDREFVETQEELGMRVMGQFRDLDDPDRFIWLRGFADMASRKLGLEAFYGGPVWAAHRGVANATMIDSDNVLLLRPAWPGAAASLSDGHRAAPGASQIPGGLIHATIFYLNEAATPELLTFCRDRMAETLVNRGAQCIGWYQSEPSANTFPRLPIRAGEHVLVGLALFKNTSDLDAVGASGTWAGDVAPALAKRLLKAPELHRLVPTARSAIHA